jgi:hypothetical protein
MNKKAVSSSLKGNRLNISILFLHDLRLIASTKTSQNYADLDISNNL